MDPADAVLRFLESAGRRDEAEFYLALFRTDAKERFATISVDAQVARQALEAVVLDLRFLAALGLTPVVVLGLIDPAQADEHAARLERRLRRADVPAAVLPSAHTPDLPEQAAREARAGTIPIIPFDAADGATPDERFARLAVLLGAFQTRKLIFLNRRGVLRQRGAPVSIVNLTTEYESFAASRELSRKQHLIVVQARRLIFELVPHRLLISITSPLELLRELFTIKGAGTLLRRGFTIERRAGWAGVDRDRLRALLESSFGRPPVDAFFHREVSRVYLEESYRGAAILVDTALGTYLSKFAVDREAQGEGMGRDLWEVVAAEHRTIFWRARADNAISAWYAKLCDGLARFTHWNVYWKGLPTERIPRAIEYALTQPIDIPHDALAV